jgi:hypothetical protein
VVADQRPPSDLASALISGESGLWVAACTARWVLDTTLFSLANLSGSLQAALRSSSAPLREAAALAVVRAIPGDAPRLLAPLADDPAASVSHTVRQILQQRAPRATA